MFCFWHNYYYYTCLSKDLGFSSLTFIDKLHCPLLYSPFLRYNKIIWAPSSEFVSSSIPSWQILTVHAQPFKGARDLAFCLKVPLDSLLVWASSGGSGETARMPRLAWTFAACIGDKYQIRLTRSNFVLVYCLALWDTAHSSVFGEFLMAQIAEFAIESIAASDQLMKLFCGQEKYPSWFI